MQLACNDGQTWENRQKQFADDGGRLSFLPNTLRLLCSEWLLTLSL